MAAKRPQKPVAAPEQVRFTSSVGGGSNLSGILGLAQSLPPVSYDSKRLGYVVNATAAEKNDLLITFNNSADSLTRVLEQIGLLMASYDKGMGTIDAEKIVELGWSINGISDMLLQLQAAREQLEDAEAAHG